MSDKSILIKIHFHKFIFTEVFLQDRGRSQKRSSDRGGQFLRLTTSIWLPSDGLFHRFRLFSRCQSVSIIWPMLRKWKWLRLKLLIWKTRAINGANAFNLWDFAVGRAACFICSSLKLNITNFQEYSWHWALSCNCMVSIHFLSGEFRFSPWFSSRYILRAVA